MDIYFKKIRWKWGLLIVAIIIVSFSLFYTNNVVSKLAKEEEKKVQQWANAIVELGKIPENPDCYDINTEFIFSILRSNEYIPAILTDENKTIINSINLNENRIEQDTGYLRQELTKMQKANPPIVVSNGFDTFYLFYKNSRLLNLLIYFPYFQLGLIAVFLGLAYWGFSAARMAEQNKIWVGMAKETAHQLGTPITSIVAWIEYLQSTIEDEASQELIGEFRNDVGRLELIADRFSKIGSVPELEPTNLMEVVEENMAYMQRRAPRKVVFEIPSVAENPPVMVQLNRHLFDWVLENLLRNALDAMEREGQVGAAVTQDDRFVYLDISDTGKGIPANRFKTVFKPGYSTKKRGWGLGLSLTQRIVQNYHNGKIFVKESEIGKGTTFRVQLPKS